MFRPAYLSMDRRALQERAHRAVATLADCRACPRDCGVDRLADRYAACKTGRYAVVGSYFPHFGEEDCLRGWNGSGTIFFSHCNLRCVFCFHPDTLVATEEGLMRIADIFGRAEANGRDEHVRTLRDTFRVVTREGKWAPVAKAFRHPFAGALIRLKPYNCPPLLLTPNHRVFAVSKDAPECVRKVRADQLTKADYLVVPHRASGDQTISLLGMLPSYHRWEPPPTKVIEGRIVNQSTLHYVRFPKISPDTGERRSRWKQSGQGFLVPIHSVERVPYAGPVFNLEIDDPDHSYLAPFVAVANCQNYDISQAIRPGPGAPAGSPPQEIAGMMLELQGRGCHNINFVTPEHVVPQVLEAVAEAVDQGLSLPIVYNTSAYDSLESLAFMDGIVDIYMPDFKYWSSDRSRTYMKAEDYPEAARAAIREMRRQVGDLVFDADGLARRGLLIRHLVMPGCLDETRAILTWIADALGPNTYVNLMDQYYPAGKVDDGRYAEINRRLTRDEFREAQEMARDLGLRRLDERRPHPRLLRLLR